MMMGWTQIIFAGFLLVIVRVWQEQNSRTARRVLRWGTVLLTVLSLFQIFMVEKNGVIGFVTLSINHHLILFGCALMLGGAVFGHWREKMRGSQYLLRGLAIPSHAFLDRRIFWEPNGTQFFISGLFRPILVLGQKSWRSLGFTQRSLILAHEEAHLLGRDLVWRFFLFVVSPLHLLNPFFFFCRRRMALLDELVADEWALQKTGAQEKDLVQLLVSLASQESVPSLSWRQYFGSSMTVLRAQFLARRSQRRSAQKRGSMGKQRWHLLAPLVFVVWSLMTISAAALENRWVRAEVKADGWHWVRSDIHLGIVNNFLAKSDSQDLRCEKPQE